MPYTPIKILVLYDDAKGMCGAIVPRMVELLENRAFEVETHRIQDGKVDIEAYKGIVIGSPVYGFGLKGVGPTKELARYVADELPDLDDVQVALFCVYQVRPGMTLDRMKGMIFEKGARYVAAHAYWTLKPAEGDHIVPAECMVRIR